MSQYNPLTYGYYTQVEALDQFIEQSLQKGEGQKLVRLTTYIRRYVSPLIVRDLFLDESLSVLVQRQHCETVTALMLDLRGYVRITVLSEQTGTGLDGVADLLRAFFSHIIRIAFENYGLVGEFAGDRVLMIFGFPPQSTSTSSTQKIEQTRDKNIERAVNTAFTIQRVIEEIRENDIFPSGIRQYFEAGIGISIGGPAWIGDISGIDSIQDTWRQELTVISKAANIASRAEDMTKEERYIKAAPHRKIIVDGAIFEHIAKTLPSSYYQAADLGEIQIRGASESIRMVHLIDVNPNAYSTPPVSTEARMLTNWLCDYIEGALERDAASRIRRALLNVQQRIASDLSINLQDVFDQIIAQIGQLFHAKKATLYEYNSTRRTLTVRSAIGNSPPPPGLELLAGEGISGQVALSGEEFISGDVRRSPSYLSKYDSKVRSMMCVPLQLQDRMLGVLQVMSDEVDSFNELDLQKLGMFAGSAVLALSNAQKYEQERRLADARTKISEALTIATSREQVLSAVLEAVKETLKPSNASLYLVDPVTEEIVIAKYFSESPTPPRINLRLPLDKGIVGYVITSKQPQLIQDLNHSTWRSQIGTDMRSMVCVPMIARRQAVGAIQILDENPHAFTHEHLETLQWLSVSTAVAVDAANRLERERRKLIAAETIAGMGAMASKLAHSIKNHVGLIRLIASSIETQDRDIQEEIDKIAKHAGKTLSEVDKALQPLDGWKSNRLDIDRVLKSLVDEVQKELHDKEKLSSSIPRIQIDYLSFGVPLFVEAGNELLKFVFHNLVDNAIRAIQEKGAEIGKIKLITNSEWTGGNNYCVVEVIDDGIGIHSTDLERIFEPAFTTRPAGTIGGFGLFHVRLNLERIDGRISVTSEPGNETKFRVFIPMIKGDELQGVQ